MQTASWHSTRPQATVHHNNNECTEGNNIENKYKKPGTGGRKLCKRCQKLNTPRK